MLDQGVRITGAADHAVSEAIYFDDPDGNGIEIYRDRDPADWPRDEHGNLKMVNARLDLEVHSGDVVLRLPANTNAEIDLEAYSGRLRNDTKARQVGGFSNRPREARCKSAPNFPGIFMRGKRTPTRASKAACRVFMPGT